MTGRSKPMTRERFIEICLAEGLDYPIAVGMWEISSESRNARLLRDSPKGIQWVQDNVKKVKKELKK